MVSRVTRIRTEQRMLSTVLTPEEQLRVDAAGEGVYHSCHRQAMKQVIADVQHQRAAVVLISVKRCESNPSMQIVRAIREIPRIPAIALLSDMTSQTPETLLLLGLGGVKRVVDVRSASGWTRLRDLVLEECADAVERIALQRLQHTAGRMSTDCWTFFRMLFRTSRDVSSVQLFAEKLEILPSTLMSRFYRVCLPAPKRYLAMARLVRAAYLLENEGFSVANVANHLEYSSPQSFGRHIRTVMKMTGMQFRKTYTGDKMLRLFEEELVLPYTTTLAWFRPLSKIPYRMGTSATTLDVDGGRS